MEFPSRGLRARPLVLASALTLAAALAIVAAHTPPARTWVRAWAVRQLASSAGIDASIGGLSYNLFTLDLRATDVRLAAADRDRPFLSIARVHVDVPWRALFGAMRLQTVDLDGVDVTIERAADGTLNLPAGQTGAPSTPLAALPIDRVAITGARVRYTDVSNRVRVEVANARATLEPQASGGIGGAVTTDRATLLAIGDTGIEGSLSGVLTYDGSALGLRPLAIEASGTRVVLDGSVDLLGTSPAVRLSIDGRADLAALSSTLAPGEPLRGDLTLSAAIDGPRAAPSATMTLSSAGVGWRDLVFEAVSARIGLSPEALIVDRVTASFAGGSLEASGRLALDTLRASVAVRGDRLPLEPLAGGSLPVRVASEVSLNAEASLDLRNGLAGLDGRGALRFDGPRVPGRALAVDGNVSWEATGGAWALRPRVTVARAVEIDGTLDGRFGADLAASTLDGGVRLAVDDAGALAGAAAAAGWLPPDQLTPASGRADLALRLLGTAGAPEVSGRLEFGDVRLAGVGPIDGAAAVAVDAMQARVDAARLTIGRNTIGGRIALDLDGERLRGRLTASLDDFDALGPHLAAWRPSGALQISSTLAGSLERPALTAAVAGTELVIAGQHAASLAADLTYQGDRVVLSRLDVEQREGGRLTAEGDYRLKRGTHRLTLAAEDLRLAPVDAEAGAWPIRARVSGGVTSGGTWDRPDGSGHFDVADVEWDGARLDRVSANLRLTGQGVTLHASVPSLALSADALIVPRPPYRATLAAGATGTSIPALARALGPWAPARVDRLDGRFSARVSAAGALDDPARLSADAVLLDLALESGAARLDLEAPATARYASNLVEIDRLRLRTGATTVDLAGAIAPPPLETGTGLTLGLDGTLADLEPWLSLAGAPAGMALDGRLRTTLEATGILDALRVTGDVHLDGGRLSWDGYPAVTDVTTQLTLDGDAIQVPTLRARWQDVGLDAQARVPLRFLEERLPAALVTGLRAPERRATFSARVEGITPAVAAPFVDAATLEVLNGRADLSVTAEAESPALEHLAGSLIVRALSGSAASVPIEQRQPTEIAIADGRVRVVGWTWDVAGSTFGVSGSAALTGARDLDARVDGRLDLRVLRMFAPAAAAGGAGDLSLSVRGTVDAPRAEGTIALDNAELALADPPVGMTGASGRIVLTPDRIGIERLDGAINGGPFVLRGGVEYQGWRPTGGTLTLDAEGVAFDVPPGFRTQVGAKLNATLGDRVAVTGRIDVLRGGYREPISLAALVAETARSRQTAAGPAGSPGLSGSPGLMDRIDLDVAVASADDLAIDNNYGRLDLGLDVRLVGTAAAPSVVGRATIRDGGVLFLGGRTYLVERGVIDFTDPRGVVPDLDLSARTRVSGTDETNAPTDYDITLAISGTPDRLDTTLTSDPPRGQADLVSLLATGRLADQAGGAGAAVARDQVLGYLSGEALGFAARAVGLDSIRFEQGASVDALQSDPSIAGEVNPAQRLTLSRRVSRFVDLTVSQNLRDTGRFTWIVTYAPRRAVEVRTVSRDDRSRSYELRHDVSFGGPPPPPRRTTAAPPARIVDVQVTGHTMLPAAELTRQLSLGVGDRFDYARWQRDRERLRRVYLDRGFLEARVTARQEPVSGAAPGGAGSEAEAKAGLRITYEVDPGPPTVLTVDGYRLSNGALETLRAVWSNAIVALVLVDDLRATVARHLAGDGYLRPSIDIARTTAPDGTVTIRIGIDPGPPTRERIVKVEGATRLPASAIESIVTTHGLDAWLSPSDVAGEIARQYEQRGLLEARVTVGPIVFDGTTAVLPVRVDEGRVHHIGRVTIEGVQARDAAAVTGELGLAAGAPYLPDEVEAGRQRVRQGYAAAGFAEARDEIRTTVDPDRGTVDVHLRLDEGPRQIVQGVTVTGADDVAARVVRGALAVREGAPADPDLLYASRRRLLQTGLFRTIDFNLVPVDTSPGTPPPVPAVPGAPTTVPGAAPPAAGTPVRLDVTVVRRTPWRLRYGVDVTDEDAPVAERSRVFGGGVNANLERFGLFGRPGTAGLTLRYNPDRRLARGVVTWPTLFGMPLASRLYLSRSRDSVEGENILAFVTDRSVVTAEQRVRPFGRAEIAYAYQFELNHVFDPNPDPDDPFAIDERWRQARLTASFVLDTRSDPIEPRRGQLHASNVEYGLEVLGRNGRFVKYSAQQFVFTEVAGRWLPGVVSASGARVSAGRGFGGQDLILSERFYAGGANTVRGYPEDALGGVDFFGDPVPGQATLVLNQEIRFPVYGWIRGVGFVDAGNVFRNTGDLALRGLNVGGGFGLRFATPVGLLRLDVAVPVPRRERPARWTFAFGHIF